MFDYVMNPIICVIWCSKAAVNFLPQCPSRSGPSFFALLFTRPEPAGHQGQRAHQRGDRRGPGRGDRAVPGRRVPLSGRHARSTRPALARPFYDPATFSWGGLDRHRHRGADLHRLRRHLDALGRSARTRAATSCWRRCWSACSPASSAACRSTWRSWSGPTGRASPTSTPPSCTWPGSAGGPVAVRGPEPGAAGRHRRLRAWARTSARAGCSTAWAATTRSRAASSAPSNPRTHIPRNNVILVGRAGARRRLHRQLRARRRAAELRRVHRLHGRQPVGLRALLVARRAQDAR